MCNSHISRHSGTLTCQPIDVIDHEVVRKSENVLRIGNLERLILQRCHVVSEVVRQVDSLYSNAIIKCILRNYFRNLVSGNVPHGLAISSIPVRFQNILLLDSPIAATCSSPTSYLYFVCCFCFLCACKRSCTKISHKHCHN